MARSLELQWTKDVFRPKEVTKFYMKHVIVQVEEGYYGILEEESISKDQMYFITGVRTQARVALRNDPKPRRSSIYSNQGNVTISMPLNAPLKFHVMNRDRTYDNAQSKTLEEIKAEIGLIEDLRLKPDECRPVEFLQGFKADDTQTVLQLHELVIMREFDQQYLVGFPLPDLNSPHESTCIFPVHMDLQLRVAEKFDGGTRQDYEQKIQQLLEKTRLFVHDATIHGNQEIMMYSDQIDEEDPYEYIQPSDYIRVTEFKRPSVPERKESRAKSRPAAPNPRNSDYEDTSSWTKPTKKQGPPTALKPAITKQKSEPANSGQNNKPTARLRHNSEDTYSKRTSAATSIHIQDSEGKPEKPEPVPSSRGLRRTPYIQDSEDKQAQQERMPGPWMLRRSQSHLSPETGSTAESKASTGADTSPRRLPRQHSIGKMLTKNTKINVVPPMQKTLPKQVEDEPCEYKTFSEIPKDIAPLSVKQIGACLRRMNMDKYVKEFEKFQIDGSLLLALDDETLQNDFSMTLTERTKIKMFAHKRWRPNQASSS